MAHAISLLSGGLDSLLAILLLRRQGVKVTAVTFLMHFGCDMSDRASCTTDASSLAARFGFTLKMSHLADKFTEIVKNPKFGHGKNMNPCLDCRILMLREARELMRMTGADFISTGEVLGQRPMSQRRDTFPVIDRESDLKGLVLRPLSAKLLNPTVPELQGLVDREQLMGFSGRSRKPQMALAKEFALTEYPAPAGGCLLTDPIYSYRLKELLAHTPDPSLKDLHLLRLGRQFRLPGGRKFVMGRQESDNVRISALADQGDVLIDIVDFGSPLAIVDAGATAEELRIIAAATARYTKGCDDAYVTARIIYPDRQETFSVRPALDEELDPMRLEMPEVAAEA